MAKQNAQHMTELVAARRPGYLADLADGTDRFFEPRRTECPWCGSDRLVRRLRTTDLLQHKPGRFVLDRCQDCTHLFQNPRLTGEGLEFYYRDVYDGLGEAKMSKLFEGRAGAYASRAEMITPHHAPEFWLDVGTGHGHFCEAAKTVHPGTVFDGLDISDGVRRAEENGFVRQSYRGSFVDLSGDLDGKYDVISMFHYLEHTADPRAEIVAAAKALRPGGFLLIELPNPESRWNKVLGRYWMPWLQPQHLNMMPLGNLREAVVESGLTPVAEQHAEPHEPTDLVMALYLLIASKFSDDDRPWQATSPGLARKVLCKIVWTLALPLLVLAALVDKAVAPLARKHGAASAYRFLAVAPPADG